MKLRRASTFCFCSSCLLICFITIISTVDLFHHHNRFYISKKVCGEDNHDQQKLLLFEKRRQTAAEACRRHFGYDAKITSKNESLRIAPNFFEFTFYNDEFKFIFCTIPKVASTNIKEMLANLLLPSKMRNIHNLIELADAEQIQRRLSNEYTKIVFVRHPLDRLISAWRNKFSHGLPTEQPRLFQIGQQILSSREGSHLDLDIRLDEFLQFIVKEAKIKADRPYEINEHWRSYVDQCDPCRINYDYIGHFENFEEELTYVMKHTFASRRNHDDADKTDNRMDNYFLSIPKPDGNSFAAAASVNETTRKRIMTLRSLYANQMTPDLLQQVVNTYINDYDIFGYPTSD